MLKLIDLNYDNIDDGLYELEVSYYELLFNKEMGDGVVFESGTRLRMLSGVEDKQFFVETVNGDKSLFWACEHEVKFLESKIENWNSDNVKLLKKYIHNDFL